MPKPKQKRIIVLQSSNHDSESGSLRDASAHSTNVTLKNLIVANGTGESQDGSTESEGQDTLTGEGYSIGNDSSESGVGNDILIGDYSEIPPIFETLTLPLQRPPISSFTDTIDGELFSSGASSVEATLLLPSIQRSREAVSEFSGTSSIEAILLLPAIQNIREHAHFSGASSVETTFTSISVNNTLGVIL
jgi:hypothetical protein